MDDFRSAWFQDVPALLAKTDEVYAKLAGLGKPSKLAATKAKIYASRRWKPASAYIEANFDAVLRATGMFYLPKALPPGPAFVFPLRDLDGRWGQAQVRPFEGSCLFLPDHKYRRLGTPYAFKGPVWCGNDDETLRQIIARGAVTLVEGPFDALACKLLAPGCPVLSSLTKGVTEDHMDFLRILGVTRLSLMFDNERSGQGAKGEALTKWRIENKLGGGMRVEHADCPASDPGEALQSDRNAVALLEILEGL